MAFCNKSMAIFFSRLFLVLLIAGSAFPAIAVGAPSTGSPGSGFLENPLGAGTDLNELVSDILHLIVQVGSIVVILMLVYVGFKFVTAHGEPGAISEARSALLWTLIGALILLGAEAIAQGIQATVNEFSQ